MKFPRLPRLPKPMRGSNALGGTFERKWESKWSVLKWQFKRENNSDNFVYDDYIKKFEDLGSEQAAEFMIWHRFYLARRYSRFYSLGGTNEMNSLETDKKIDELYRRFWRGYGREYTLTPRGRSIFKSDYCKPEGITIDELRRWPPNPWVPEARVINGKTRAERKIEEIEKTSGIELTLD